jgi:hypothetical protein
MFSFIDLRKRFSYFLSLVSTFFVLHFSYGLGSLWGICRLFRDKFVGKKNGAPELGARELP